MMTRTARRSNLWPMNWFPNPDRITEIFSEESVQKAAKAVLRYRNKEVLQVLAWGWAIFLAMTFSLLFTIRLAFTLPLF